MSRSFLQAVEQRCKEQPDHDVKTQGCHHGLNVHFSSNDDCSNNLKGSNDDQENADRGARLIELGRTMERVC